MPMRTSPVNNEQGIRNLCEVASFLLSGMPVNAATKFAVRTVLREASNKSRKHYRGNNNKLNASFASVAAAATDSTNVIADHAVPLSLMLDRIYSNSDWSTDQLVELVREYSTIVLITPDEDRALLESGLKKHMPQDWCGKNILARYEHLGIKVRPYTA